MNSPKRTGTSRRFAGLDAGSGPARPLSSADTEWIVEQVVERALYPDSRLRQQRLSLRTIALAGVAVVTSAAAATIVHHELGQNAATSAPAASVLQRQITRHAPGIARRLPVSEPSAQAAPSAVIPAPVHEVPASVASTSKAVVAARVTTAVDELSAANDLRRKAQWQAAEAAYRGIAAHYPQAPESAVAQLAAAELRLEHLNDAAGALRLYQTVPQKSALGVEALFGVSRAQRALGNSAAEAAALRSLLEAYPTSLQADRARERLEKLTNEPVNP